MTKSELKKIARSYPWVLKSEAEINYSLSPGWRNGL